MSFAAKAIAAGDYESAITQATAAIEREASDPEAWFERATAYAWMNRHLEAAADFERALAVDAEGILETDAVDDAYFSTLLGAARKEAAVADGCKHLERYATVLANGRHREDAVNWARRLRGELKSAFIKHPEEPGSPP